MKFFLVLGIVLLGVWLWRSSRKDPRVKPPAEAPRSALEMVSCPWCGTHVPKSDALAGAGGFYCSLEHRQNAEP
jgi:uncharacterized protein